MEVTHWVRPRLFERLREETREHHDRAEAVAGIPNSFQELAHQLQRMHAFFRRWEPVVERAAPGELRAAWQGAWRTPALEQDLRALGSSPLPADVMPTLPAIDDGPALVGSMYVIEGSALGGQVVASAIERRLGITAQTGASFFHGFGPATMLHWRVFQASAASLVEPQQEHKAIASARATFDCYSRCMQGLTN